MLYVVPDLVHSELFADTPEEGQLNVDQYVMKDKALLYDTPEEFRALRGEKGVRGTVTWASEEKGRQYHQAVVAAMADFVRQQNKRTVKLRTTAAIV